MRAMDGWTSVEIMVRGGPEEAARLLQQLVSQGVPLAAMERVPISLASLIESVVKRGAGSTQVEA